MIKKIKVITYNKTSISAKAISRFWPGKNRILKNSSSFRSTFPLILINWGFRGRLGDNFYSNNITLINKPEAVEMASNKIKCLKILEENNVPTLKFTTDKEEAIEFLRENNSVYCRTKISSHSGKGIVIASNENEIVDAALYTAKFTNDIEYRVHVFNGKVIDVQQKKKMTTERRASFNITNIENDIRNLKNGWSFVRTNLNIKREDGSYITDIIKIPLAAIDSLGLDFGAVDLAYDSLKDKFVVLEVNTAAGQKTSTTTNFNYIKAISEIMNKPITINDYNNRWGCNISNFNNGINNLINKANE